MEDTQTSPGCQIFASIFKTTKSMASATKRTYSPVLNTQGLHEKDTIFCLEHAMLHEKVTTGPSQTSGSATKSIAPATIDPIALS